MSTLSDTLVFVDGCWIKTCQRGFCANIDGWESLLFSALPTSSSPWWLYDDKSWQTNHQHVILKDTVYVTLLAGASALYFSSLLVVGVDKERGRKSRMMLSEQNPAGFQRLMTEAVCVWEPPEESGRKKCEHSSHKQYRQTGWLLMSRSYLAGNLERGQRLYASMWQCVKAGCRNANKATLHLLGTDIQIRCE